MPDNPRKRISQTQIAKELGYSQALVSMVLNGRRKGISAEAYERIWDYAIAHGYSPRGMSIDSVRESSNSNTIGYILRSPLKLATKSNFFDQVHQGLYDYLESRSIKTVFLGAEDDIEVERLPQLGVLTNSVKAVAIMGEVQPEFLDGVRKLDLPIAYISARSSGKCHSVLSNESESGELLVDHLCKLGHTQFAWLGGNRPLGRFRDRFKAVTDALQSRGLSMGPSHIVSQIDGDRKEGYRAAEELIAKNSDDLPTAWICLNGLMARGAINCLYRNGYEVGKDVSIAAFDRTNVCVEEHPTITGASAIPEDMGAEAAKILLASMRGEMKALTDVTLPAELQELESTGTRQTAAADKPA